MAELKDSGTRREFETGAVRDIQEGKGRCDLMPLEVVRDLMPSEPSEIIRNLALFKSTNNTDYLRNCLAHFARNNYAYGHCSYLENLSTMFLEVSKHFEDGAKKYGENNWQKGIPVNCYVDSATRHFLKWLRGDEDEPHDRAFVWNLMCCIWEVDYRDKENSKDGE